MTHCLELQDRETRTRRYLVERTDFDPHLDLESGDTINSDVTAYDPSVVLATDPTLAMEIRHRSQAIQRISGSIRELATLFRDLDRVVVDQGTVLDRIDWNVEQANIGVRKGLGELTKADRYQRRGTQWRMMALITLSIIAIILLIVILPGSDNKDVVQSGKDPGNSEDKIAL